MVEFRCIGHDSRHVCRSVLVAPGGFFVFEDHIVHVYGMVWCFIGADKIFSCKMFICN